MKSLLRKIKEGDYATVIGFDKDNNLKMHQLRYNPIRRKFYLSENKRGLFRKQITTKQAADLLRKTLFIKQND